MRAYETNSELVPVYRAANEPMAHLIKSLLEQAGIESVVWSRQIPWMDGVMVNAEGYWGEVLTVRSDSERALDVLRAYESGDFKIEQETTGEPPAEDAR
ncbi:MAG: DUF2007 domain-containing protein [Armatimonadota bacterium]|nr:DUF2007 domain-containing protein [Armatimonadota bacterium]